MAKKLSPLPDVWQQQSYVQTEDLFVQVEISLTNLIRVTVCDDDDNIARGNLTYLQAKELMRNLKDTLRKMDKERS